MWKSGMVDSYNVQGLAAFDVETSSDGESHTLHWTN
jgi:hypothetical protein